jgi:two-component system OmpR family sensor kinase
MIATRLRANVRTRLLVVVLIALAAALAVSTYGFNLLFARSTARSADSLLRARANSEAGLLRVRHGRLTATETADDSVGDSGVWIFANARVIEQPRAHNATDAAARSLAGGPARFRDVPSEDVRLYAQPVVIGGKRVGTVVTGLSVRAYEDSQRTALLGSLALALVTLALVGLGVRWLLRSALRPVARMTEQASAWSAHDLDRRFGLGEPHDELTQLAATLDGLLDRIAASLRHERRFSAELSHELRTPLARVIAEAELALRRDREPAKYREALESVLRSARQLARIVETLVAAAQHEVDVTRGTADAYAVATGAVEAVSELAEQRNLRLAAEEPAAALRLGVDGQLAERVLQPILENACRYGTTWARVRISRHGARVLYLVEDDGPGVTPDELELIFEPGIRGSAGEPNGTVGAGLGLALARRLARAAAGDVTVNGGEGGSFVVSLPAA